MTTTITTASGNSLPLCADLDGTLIRSDLLWESLLSALARHPWIIFWLPVWLVRGRAYLKARLADHARVDPATLPYRKTVIDFLVAEKKTGRQVVLVTASNERLAAQVAEHLGFFDQVFASSEQDNLKGRHKREFLQQTFPDGYDYIGDSRADLSVWEGADQAFLVEPARGLEEQVKTRRDAVTTLVPKQRHRLALIKALRPHQWLKNLLIFLPVLAAHQWTSGPALTASVLAFVAFSLVASANYLINDLLDLQADRHHPRKRFRPMASGRVGIIMALITAAVLIVSGFWLAYFIKPAFFLVLIGYYVATLSYSLWLKRRLMIDVLLLALLYTLRIIAGGVAASIMLSNWLVFFSLFLFFSLALVKRYSELVNSQSGPEETRRRAYEDRDLPILAGFGITSSLAATLVMALYVQSADVVALYQHPQVLWALCPILLYWTSKIWILANRGKMHDDPLVYAARDPKSLLTIGFALVVILAAL